MERKKAWSSILDQIQNPFHINQIKSTYELILENLRDRVLSRFLCPLNADYIRSWYALTARYQRMTTPLCVVFILFLCLNSSYYLTYKNIISTTLYDLIIFSINLLSFEKKLLSPAKKNLSLNPI